MPDNFSLDGSGSEHSSRLLDKIEREYSYTELNHGPESGFSSPSEPGDLKTKKEGCCGCIAWCWYRVFPYGFTDEFKAIISLAWTMTFTQLFQFLNGIMAVIFCGHLGKYELGAVALAISTINVTGFCVAVGLAFACDTLFAQTYGSSNPQKMGIVLQRSILFLALSCLLCWAIQINCEGIFRGIGEDEIVAKLAGDYVLTCLPAVFMFFMFTPLSKYLQNQTYIMPVLIISLISNFISAPLHYLLVYHLDLGTQGSAYAIVAAHTWMFSATLIYIIVTKVYEDTWFGWDWECLQDWGAFTELAVSGLAMTGLEWGSFEIAIFIAGILGTTQLASQSILFQLEMFCYMIPLGLSLAACIRVGYHLGAGSAAGAQTATRVSMTVTCIMGVIVGTLLITLRNQFPRIFTNEEDVVDMCSGLLPVLGIYMTLDYVNGLFTGIFRGCGRQTWGSIASIMFFISTFGIGIPLMFLTDLGLGGFWWALVVSLFIRGVISLIIISRISWDTEVAQAKLRTIERSSTPEPDVPHVHPGSASGLTPRSTPGSIVDLTHQSGTSIYGSSTHSGVSTESELLLNRKSGKPSSGILRNRLIAVICVLSIFLLAVTIRVRAEIKHSGEVVHAPPVSTMPPVLTTRFPISNTAN